MQFVGYKPFTNPVVIRMLDAEEKVGMIHIPASARQQTDFGEVVYSSHPDFKPGDFVHVRSYSGCEFELWGDKKLTSVGLEEILGTLVPGDEASVQ